MIDADGPNRPAVGAFALLALLAVPLVLPAVRGQPGDALRVLATRLPFGWSEGAAVYAADAIYLIGGSRNGTDSDTITRFDPMAATFVDEPVRLPAPRYAVSTAWTGTEILIFGGKRGVSDFADILRFNPVTHEIVRGANLTSARGNSVAFWDGRDAWVVGGFAGFGGTEVVRRDVVRYHPQTDSATAFPAEALGLATYFAGTWDGTRATLFGGAYDFDALRFDPDTQQFGSPTVTPGSMPRATAASAVQSGPYAYIFGGVDGGTAVDRVVRFHTEDARWELLPVTLDLPLYFTASAWTGRDAYVFGGRSTPGYGTDLIHVFTAASVDSAEWPVTWVAGGLAAVAIPTTVILVRRRRHRRQGLSEGEVPDVENEPEPSRKGGHA